MLCKVMPQSATEFGQAAKPVTRFDFGFARDDVLKLPLQQDLIHADLLNGFNFEDNVIIAPLGLHVRHDGKVGLGPPECLENEAKIDRCQAVRSWCPRAIAVFEQLATMTPIKIPGHQRKELAMQ